MSPHKPDLRAAALQDFEVAWAEAIRASSELHRAFDRLGGALEKLAGHGSRQTLSFEGDLEQRWWVVFQESRGSMIPREPELPPIPALN